MTTTDEEIVRAWDEIHRQSYIGVKECSNYQTDKKVAIRLWRMAEAQGHENAKHVQVCNQCLDKPTGRVICAKCEKEELAEARASALKEVNHAKELATILMAEGLDGKGTTGKAKLMEMLVDYDVDGDVELEKAKPAQSEEFVKFLTAFSNSRIVKKEAQSAYKLMLEKYLATHIEAKQPTVFTDETVNHLAALLIEQFGAMYHIMNKENQEIVRTGFKTHARSLLQFCNFKSEEEIRADERRKWQAKEAQAIKALQETDKKLDALAVRIKANKLEAYAKGQAEALRGFNRTEFANSVRAELIEKLKSKLTEWRNKDQEHIGGDESGFYAAGARDRTDAILQILASESAEGFRR